LEVDNISKMTAEAGDGVDEEVGRHEVRECRNVDQADAGGEFEERM
jgi:hypothetical protein